MGLGEPDGVPDGLGDGDGFDAGGVPPADHSAASAALIRFHASPIFA